MAEISRRAGVGMATLYRNFPGRRELLEALYTDEVNAICEAAETVDGETPGAVLMAWLHRFFAFSTSKRHIASELLTHVDSSNPVFGESRARVLAAGRPLLVAAQRTHEVRDDLTLEQILDMIVAIATIHGDSQLPRADPPDRARRPSPPDRCRYQLGHPGPQGAHCPFVEKAVIELPLLLQIAPAMRGTAGSAKPPTLRPSSQSNVTFPIRIVMMVLWSLFVVADHRSIGRARPVRTASVDGRDELTKRTQFG